MGSWILGSKVSRAFTLIEVLVALAILSIALLAVIKANNQTLRMALSLHDKTVATWVAQYELTRAQLGLIPLEVGGITQGEDIVLSERWVWHLRALSAPAPSLKAWQIEVGKDHQPPEVEMTTYA